MVNLRRFLNGETKMVMMNSSSVVFVIENLMSFLNVSSDVGQAVFECGEEEGR